MQSKIDITKSEQSNQHLKPHVHNNKYIIDAEIKHYAMHPRM